MKTILWITNNWNSLDHTNDTTLRLIQESQNHDIINYWCSQESIHFISNNVIIEAYKIFNTNYQRTKDSFHFKEKESLTTAKFDIINYRVDPPVNDTYKYYLQLLRLGINRNNKNTETQIINPPQQLLLLSEKFEQFNLDYLFPESVISSNLDILLKFIKTHKYIVLKPLNNAQSKGIKLLEWKNEHDHMVNLKTLHKETQAHTSPILLQQYLKGIMEGELRLWFVNGILLAAVKKIPIRGNPILNMDLGDKVIPANLNSNEIKISDVISKYLKSNNIFLAAIDLIDNKITDFNITSPGLIVEMENVLKQNLAKKIILEFQSIL